MDDITNIIAQNIARLRRESGMTQSELAGRMHYSDKLVSKWERGEAAPNAASLWEIAQIFGVPVDELYRAPGEAGKAEKTAEPEPHHRGKRRERALITAIALCGVLLAVTLVFDISWMLGRPFWRVYIALLPMGLMTLLVLNTLWNKGKGDFLIVGLLIPATLLTIYLALLPRQTWQLFLLLPPAEAIVFLSWRLHVRTKKG